jgi:Fe-S-cluster containining protein
MEQSEVLLPPRSYLYPLEPKGIGTPFTESLISYMIRLAKVYCVSPKVLVIQEILPLLDLSPSYTYRIHARWSEEGQNLNDLNASTAKWTQALKQLTSRDDLHLLTMMTWSGVLSQSGMFRDTKAWCSACYNEWHASQEVYEPLLWAFQAVTVCPRHCQPLSLRCSRQECGRSLPALSKKSLPGYCPWCGIWLGTTLRERTTKALQEDDKRSCWIANAIGELIAMAKSFVASPHKEMFSSTIRSQMTKLNVSAAASQMLVSPELLYSWSRGKRKPQLSTLLQVSLGLCTSPLELLTGNAVSALVDGCRTSTEHLQDIHGGRRITPSRPDEVLRALEAVLLSECKPTVKEVAKDLGYSNTCTIYEHGPEICRAIAAKRHADTEHLQKMLEAIMVNDENPPPSMREVARRLGYSVQVLCRHFPAMCRAISERYSAYRTHRRDETVRRICDEVRSAVLRLHAQGEYPSLRKVRSLLGKPHDMLRKEAHQAWKEALQGLGS